MKKKILNVGCGNDSYGTHFIDLYPTRREVIKCDVNKDKFPFKDNFFDEVIAIGLFEHLTNPLNFLKESYRVLKRGGKLIIITDNAGFFGIFGKVHHGGYEEVRENEGINQDRHYALFTPNHLENWLRYVGFRKIKVEYYIYERHILKKHIPLIKLLTILSKRFYPQIKAKAVK